MIAKAYSFTCFDDWTLQVLYNEKQTFDFKYLKIPKYLNAPLLTGCIASSISIKIFKDLGFHTLEKISVFILGFSFYDTYALTRDVYQYKTFKQQHLLQNTYNQKDTILILQAKSDCNKAFQIRFSTLYILKKLEQAQYTIIFNKVSSFSDIERAIDKAAFQGNQITALWLRGHGNKKAISLHEKKGELTIVNIDFLKSSFDKLKKDAVVILDACATHPLDSDQETIASKIAQVANGKRVFAAQESFSSKGFRINKFRPLEVAFFNKNNINVTSILISKTKRNL